MRLLLVFIFLPLLMGASDIRAQVSERNLPFQRLIELAEQEQEAEAQYILGLKYYNGDSVPQDFVKARKWFEKSAHQGHVDAQYNFGVMYHEGQGGPQDNDKAQEWIEKVVLQRLPWGDLASD